MINTNIYNYINVLDKAADAANSRNTILSNNIANVDTPNYRRKEVSFERYLEQALIGDESLDKRVEDINTHLNDFGGFIYTDHSVLSYRLDGNNVDIDTENVTLAANQLKYQGLTASITSEFTNLSKAAT